MTAARHPDAHVNVNDSVSATMQGQDLAPNVFALSSSATAMAATLFTAQSFVDKDAAAAEAVVGAEDEDEVDALEPRIVGNSNKTLSQQALEPYIKALYQVEEPLIGERYTDFVYDDELRPIAVDKFLYANGLNSGNTREYMMLELLLVLASQYKQDPFSEQLKDELGRVCYVKRRQLLLRRVLFNNPFLQSLEQIRNLNDSDLWHEWVRLFRSQNLYAPKVRRAQADAATTADNSNDPGNDHGNDHGNDNSSDSGSTDAVFGSFADESRIRTYSGEELLAIRDRLGSSEFRRFTQAVYLLRSWSLNFDDDKKWIYKNLFPFGRETLFCEISATTTDKADYLAQSGNYMSGCGEVLYSMLQRACERNGANSIGTKLCDKFFPEHNPINDFACALSGSRSNYEREVQETLIHCNESMEARLAAAKRVRINEADLIDSTHKALVVKTRILAVKQHEVFTHLTADFDRILSLNLSVQDQFNTLSTIGMLYVLVYLLKIGRGACALEHMQELTPLGQMINIIPDDEAHKDAIPWRNIDMVVAVKATTKSRLRQVSAQCFRLNQSLMQDSLAPYAKAQSRALMSLVNSRALNGALSPDDLLSCADILKELFHCRNDINLLSSDPKALIDRSNITSLGEAKTFEDILDFLCMRIAENGSKTLEVHLPYARSIGLVPATNSSSTSKTALTRNYYTFTDELVRNLVYATLGEHKHMLFEDFLEQLYTKYLLVIGPQQAAHNFKLERRDPNFIEEKEFTDNADDFKEQLSRLDLLLSLSDGFDYVCNPYGKN